MWPFKKKEDVEPILKKLESFKSYMSLVLLRGVECMVTALDDALTEQTRLLNDLNMKQDASHYGKVISWISPKNLGSLFQSQQRSHLEQRTEGTGVWFLELIESLKWASGEDNTPRTFSCHGGPGVGKTFLLSFAADYINQRKNHDQPSALALVIYFTAGEPLEARELMESLLAQIPPSDALVKLHAERAPQNQSLTMQEIKDILRAELAKFTQAFIFSDALDEYPDDRRGAFIETLLDLVNAVPGLKWMASTRHSPALSGLAPDLTVEILKSSEGDISLCLRSLISKQPRLNRILDAHGGDSQREQLMDTLTEKVSGMILLAEFQVNEIAKATNLRELKKILSNLPTEHHAIYSQAMERIAKQPDNLVRLAHEALSCLLLVPHLSFNDLRYILSISTERLDFAEEDLQDEESILEACSGLLQVFFLVNPISGKTFPMASLARKLDLILAALAMFTDLLWPDGS
ncbi:hypothetical protein FA15DRAFT_521137 [Coprinopsis marcescibilis]|uniref:NACHT domain-containing protein n=1 Tax=Coprinopsis marcescibilis TaxID=230819 RepID=A0A5C3L2G2_COPMA|nr:hypothetical protein FA15DRAFT_521137 [Coprinopsis marcescibilis]